MGIWLSALVGGDEKGGEGDRHRVCGEQRGGGAWQLVVAEQEALILGAS